MFRTVLLSIIRSFPLYTQQCFGKKSEIKCQERGVGWGYDFYVSKRVVV